jgi:hypothetical protein
VIVVFAMNMNASSVSTAVADNSPQRQHPQQRRPQRGGFLLTPGDGRLSALLRTSPAVPFDAARESSAATKTPDRSTLVGGQGSPKSSSSSSSSSKKRGRVKKQEHLKQTSNKGGGTGGIGLEKMIVMMTNSTMKQTAATVGTATPKAKRSLLVPTTATTHHSGSSSSSPATKTKKKERIRHNKLRSGENSNIHNLQRSRSSNKRSNAISTLFHSKDTNWVRAGGHDTNDSNTLFRKHRRHRPASNRRVRFELDKNGRIAGHYSDDDNNNDAKHNDMRGCSRAQPPPLTVADIKNTWWTRREIRRCRERAQDTCRYYLYNRPDYREAAIRILERCGAQKLGCDRPHELLRHSSSRPSSIAPMVLRGAVLGAMDDANESADDAPAASTAAVSTTSDEDNDVRIVVDSDARGLEKRLLNAMDLPFVRHKRSIRVVLDLQARLRSLSRERRKGSSASSHAVACTVDQQARLIASLYSKYCRYAAAWAIQIAKGDATTAENNTQFSV